MSIPLSLFLATSDHSFVFSGIVLEWSSEDKSGTTLHNTLPGILRLPALQERTFNADLPCYAPRCGTMRLPRGTPLGAALSPTNEDDPDDMGCVYESVVDGREPGGIVGVRFYAAAVCPRKGCWTAAMHRLQDEIAKQVAPQIIPGAKCAHCYETLDPATRVPCADECGREWYCSPEHRAAALPTHNVSLERFAGIASKTRTCGACGKQAVALRSCGRCKAVYYCDRACQMSHWPTHKSMCTV